MSDAWEFDEELASTMDAGPDLLPWLPELLQDLEDLGVRSADVSAILADSGLTSGHRVLDLGCGKGAALLAVAKERGVEGIGVDGVEAFVNHGGERSRDLGLGERVRFLCEDVHEVLGEAQGADLDLVMMLALGPILGDLSETVGRLRGVIRPGGWILIDDAYFADGAHASDPRVEGCLSRAQTYSALERWGDKVVAELNYEDEGYGIWCREMTGKIMARAGSMAQRMPELSEALLGFARRQQEETEGLGDGALIGALFLIQKGKGHPAKKA